MSEKRFVLCKKGDKEYIEDNGCIQLCGFDVLCEMLNEFNFIIEKQSTIILKLQWRFQQEVGMEKAREHYKEIDKEMFEKYGESYAMIDGKCKE